MSGAPPVQVGPDDDLMSEQLNLLLKQDGIERQRRDLDTAHGINRRRLDEIAAELRGRAVGRRQATAQKEG